MPGHNFQDLGINRRFKGARGYKSINFFNIRFLFIFFINELYYILNRKMK